LGKTLAVEPGLPDGVFSHQKSRFGYISESLGMKKVGILYGHLEYIVAILHIKRIGHLWSFGTLFPRFGILYQEKYGNPAWFSVFSSVKLTAFSRNEEVG
jgi:hypothetical protein